MARRATFHVGLMKSGTTFIQGRCNASREALAAQEILFPGPTWARHSRAISDFIESPRRVAGAWAGLRDEIVAYPGQAIVSMEYLGPVGAPRIEKLSAEFDCELRIVVTVRDLGRSVPAMWQESVKNRGTHTWEEYLHGIRAGAEHDAGRRFWRQQDAGRIVTRWARVLGPERIVVVTVPPPGAPTEELWDRFGRATGITPADWQDGPRANQSLGAASAQLMRRLNVETADLELAEYKKRVKALAKHVLSQHTKQEEPIGFTVPRWLRRRAEGIRNQIAGTGVEVIGSLDELTPLNVTGVDPGRVSPDAQLDAAVSALGSALRQVSRITR